MNLHNGDMYHGLAEQRRIALRVLAGVSSA